MGEKDDEIGKRQAKKEFGVFRETFVEVEKKGLLTHISQGNTHVYQPTSTRRQTIGPVLRNLVRQVFGGSPATAMQHLLAEHEVSADELAKLKQLIAEHEAKGDSLRTKGKKS